MTTIIKNPMFRCALVAGALLLAGAAAAAVPPSFTVQGVLRDDAGKLQTMPVDVTVTLYDAEAGGNKIAGPYGPRNVPAKNGLFNLTLSDGALKQELAQAQSGVWLVLVVGNNLFPRSQ